MCGLQIDWKHASNTCPRCNIDIHAEMPICAKSICFYSKSVPRPGPQIRILHHSRWCRKATFCHLNSIRISNNDTKTNWFLTILVCGSIGIDWAHASTMHRVKPKNVFISRRPCDLYICLLNSPLKLQMGVQHTCTNRTGVREISARPGVMRCIVYACAQSFTNDPQTKIVKHRLVFVSFLEMRMKLRWQTVVFRHHLKRCTTRLGFPRLGTDLP